MAHVKYKTWLERELNRDHRRKAREKVVALRHALRDARAQRKAAMKATSERCRADRIAARERARALRIRGLAELREATRLEREAARQTCALSKLEAKKKDGIERRRAELDAERQYQLEMRVIDAGHKKRRKEHRHATYIERRAESDGEVSSNLDPELRFLWEREKRGIKASPLMSRTEAFLAWVEEHPSDLLESLGDQTDVLVRELEKKEREAARNAKRRPAKAAAYADDVVPF